MKIIGKANNDTYLVQVSHSELEKVFDKYYGKLPQLEVGHELDLGAGYNFRSDIQGACKEMAGAMKAFDSKRLTMLRFAEMVGALSDQEGGAE